MQLCMSHTATLSHKQKLTNAAFLEFSRDKVPQNTALLGSKKELHHCSTVARHAMSHVRFCCAIKLRDKVAQTNCQCDIGLRSDPPSRRIKCQCACAQLQRIMDTSPTVWSFRLLDISPTTWTVRLQMAHFANKTPRI